MINHLTRLHIIKQNNTMIETWLVLLAIAAGVFVLLCSVTLCTVRCFRPENSRGAQWHTSEKGDKLVVKSAFDNSGRDFLKPAV